jgi:hypothetical protein
MRPAERRQRRDWNETEADGVEVSRAADVCAEPAQKKMNCPQEPGISMGTIAAKMVSMNGKPLSKRADDSRRHDRLSGMTASAVTAALFALAWLSGLAGAQDAFATQIAADTRTTGTRTAFVVFPNHPMPEDEWTALFERVQSIAAAEKIEGARDVEFVRGDAMPRDLSEESVVSVYLHGNCNLEPLPRRTAGSVRLGWVLRVNGRITPFIHVDCTRIGQVLGAQAKGLDQEARDRMMAGAVARVMVHEWIHVARQSAEHGRDGITKASFDIPDLLGEPEAHIARW